MCRKKYIAEIMGKHLTEVSFRLVLFSLPQFKEHFVEKFTHKFPKATDFEERVLTEEEQQVIDIDAVAYDLQIPLIDVICKKTFVFRDVTIGKLKCIVYINPYYVFIRAKLDENKMLDADFFVHLDGILNASIIKKHCPRKLYCLTTHYCDMPVNEVGETMDLEAFPKIDWNNYGGGNYVDNYVVNETCSIDLKRIVERYDEGTGDSEVIVNILSSAYMGEFNLDTMAEDCRNMYEYSLNEVARCFKV